MFQSIASVFARHVLSRSVTSFVHQQRLFAVESKISIKGFNEKVNGHRNTMPKKVDVKELQATRRDRKAKGRKHVAATAYLQVIGSGAEGAPKSLCVFTGQARYLFNCGEGTQRLANEHKVKLGAMEHILITHKSWSNVGGLPGVLLTLQTIGVPQINLHGPPGIESLWYDTSNFLMFRDLTICYKHYEENYGDSTDPLTIQAVPIWAKEASPDDGQDEKEITAGVQEEDLYAFEKPSVKKESQQMKDQYKTPEERTEKMKESQLCKNLAVAYICRTRKKAGALLLEKCVEAGVPPGPLLGKLKMGEDVTLPNGNVVVAADVTAPDVPGLVFIVIEAPTEAYLDSLLENPVLAKHQVTSTSGEDFTEVVVHFTPSHIMTEPRYQQWMSRFSPLTNHICINEKSLCMGSEAVHHLQYKLNLLSDNIFPLLKDSSIPVKNTEDIAECDNSVRNTKTQDEIREDGLRTENSNNNDNHAEDMGDANPNSDYIFGPTHQASTLMTYHICPRNKIDRAIDLKLTPETYIEECYAEEKFESVLNETKSKLHTSDSNKDVVGKSENYPNVIFLGTGSSIPNKYRNTSGILVSLSANKNLAMDCGEGTYGQYIRFFGATAADEALRHLTAVYISHIHADHHIGFIGILKARRRALQRAGIKDVPKLLLLAPHTILQYLTSYDANFEPILEDFTLIENTNFLLNAFKTDVISYADVCMQLDMKDISMTYVIHCPNAFGVALTHKDGWKLAYSGDTRPCSAFVELGKNCDLLIHEATMEDYLVEEARIKKHSTTSQAIQVGREMNARYILLTHFSQRYAKVPLLAGGLPENVGIAFDNMKVCLHDLSTLHHMYAALVLMFAEYYELLLERTAKKRAAKEREEEVKSLEESEKKRAKIHIL